jgi:hypothetical protein
LVDADVAADRLPVQNIDERSERRLLPADGTRRTL